MPHLFSILRWNKSIGERNVRAALTGGTAVAARAIQVGAALITIPLAIRYLGNERFGLWITISSLLPLANFADFGLGNGMLNVVAAAYGRDDVRSIRQAISSGFVLVTAICAALLVLFALAFPLVSWADVFRVTSPEARAEAGPALAVFVVIFALNVQFDLVQRAQLGIQQGYRANVWQACGSLAGLAGLVVAIRMHASLPWLVTALGGAPVAAAALNTVQFFGVSRPDLSPRWEYFSRDALSKIGRLGGLFVTLQLVVAVAFSADNLIIARALGAAEVTAYSIPQRLFSVISLIVAMLMAPLWPAYGEAIARGDTAWVRSTLVRSMMLVLGGATFASVILFILAPGVLSWWIGPQLHAPTILLLGLAIWTVMDCCGNALAMFLNGAGIIRYQVIVASLFGVACFSAKVFMTLQFGIVAVPWATIMTYALFVVAPAVLYVPDILARLHNSAAGVPMPIVARSCGDE